MNRKTRRAEKAAKAPKAVSTPTTVATALLASPLAPLGADPAPAIAPERVPGATAASAPVSAVTSSSPAATVSLDQAFAIALDHFNAGRAAAAEAILRQILALRPQHPIVLHILGMAVNAQGDRTQALALVHQAAALAPDNPDIHSNLGTIFKALDRLDEAETSYKQAITLRPDFIEAWNNLGNACHAQIRIEDAATCYRRALLLNPKDSKGLVNLGVMYRDEGYGAEAIAAFDAAMALAPNDHVSRFDRALALLVAGDLTRGFQEYELRWEQDHLRPHRKLFPEPQWQGQDIRGKILLIHGEQGFGDTLQFVRYIPYLADMGITVYLAVQPQLDRVMKTLRGVAYLHPSGQVVPPFHTHTPLISLPRLFGTTLESIPRNVPYLSAEPELLAKWATRLGPRNGRLRVGLAWAGVPTFKADARRSPRLEPLLPLLDVPGVDFYSLQMGHGRKDLEGRAMPANFTDLAPEIEDFADTAAIMHNIDLFITSCTGPAHLAGALGIPMWVMLFSAADWRWLYEREDSPWYPSARLFRQNRHGIGGWDPVVARLKAALTALAAGDRAVLRPPATPLPTLPAV